MRQHNCSLDEAEAAIGKAAPTARETALASLEALSGGGHAAMGKFLETADGELLYSEYEKKIDSISMTKAQARDALDALATVYVAELGIDRWQGMMKAVSSPLGRRLYQLNDAA